MGKFDTTWSALLAGFLTVWFGSQCGAQSYPIVVGRPSKAAGGLGSPPYGHFRSVGVSPTPF
jgi:hypothetical protein